MQINLNSIDKVKDFSSIMSQIEDGIDLSSGRYYVDAKSILGIFSLDLSKPINVEFNGIKDQKRVERLLTKFAV